MAIFSKTPNAEHATLGVRQYEPQRSKATNGRPGIYFKAAESGFREGVDEQAHMMYLMATFRGTDERRKLSLLLQHFCVPVHPHSVIGTEEDHIHTSPEWKPERSGGRNAWIIAHAYTSRGRIFGRWKDRRGSNKASFCIEQDMLAKLKVIEDSRWEVWYNMCEDDVTLSSEFFREHRVSTCSFSAMPSGRSQYFAKRNGASGISLLCMG